jgi:diguanylate cyclase (GGDEF)-like protein
LFRDRLEQELLVVERSGGKVAVLFIDLDHFKYVNDTLGHHVGDELLQAVSARIENMLRKSDTVARMGGDEFTIIVRDFSQIEILGHLSEKLIQQLKEVFILDEEEIFIGASIGIAIYPQDGTDLASLSMNADTAMYQAKEKGRNAYCFFNPEMNKNNEHRLMLERDLRYALDRNQLYLYYQPKIDLLTGKLIGVEALIRWKHHDRGLISPIDFIPLAEETGLIVPIGDWVLQEACNQAALWVSRDSKPIRMAVNLSARQFQQHEELIKSVETALQVSGLNPNMLELELTESMVMGDVNEAIQTMHALRGLGVQLAIDDFGTGYSSLEYLKRFPINTLKIDQSFVRDLTVDSDDASIVQAIIALAHSLKLGVVAEGIETQTQHEFLQNNNCAIGQGYLFSKPLPVDELELSKLHTEA